MKEEYTDPKMEIISFETADIITASNLDDDEIPSI